MRRSIDAARSAGAGDAIAEDIVSTHVRASMGDHLFDVRSTDQHTVKPWFTGKLDFSPPGQDFATIGFPLVGGRLDYVDTPPQGSSISARSTIDVLIWPDSAPATTLAAQSIRGFHFRHWIERHIVLGRLDLNDAELDQFVAALKLIRTGVVLGCCGAWVLGFRFMGSVHRWFMVRTREPPVNP